MADMVQLTLVNTAPGMPAQVTVLDGDMKQYARTILSGEHDEATVEVPPGDYILSIERQDLPSEQRLATVVESRRVEVGEPSREQARTAVRSGRLTRSLVGGAIAALNAFSDTFGFVKGLGSLTLEGHGLESLKMRVETPKCSARLRREEHFEPFFINLEGSENRLLVRSEYSFSRYQAFDPRPVSAELRSDVPAALLDWAIDEDRRLVVALPLFRGGLIIDLRDGLPIDVRPDGRSRHFAPLLDTLAANVPLDPAQIWRSSMGQDAGPLDSATGYFDYLAERLLLRKFNDPYAAALAGHFLLRFRNFDRVSTWTRNLADYFPAISDGCILEGWRRLQGGKNSPWAGRRQYMTPPEGPLNPKPNAPRPDNPIEDAARRFTEAVARGRPVFHHGVGRLLDGLYFCLDRLDKGSLRDRVIEDIATAAAWQRSCFSLDGLTAFEMSRAELDERTVLIAEQETPAGLPGAPAG